MCKICDEVMKKLDDCVPICDGDICTIGKTTEFIRSDVSMYYRKDIGKFVLHAMTFLYHCSDDLTTIFIEIEYCPFCGKKLEAHEE